LVVAGFLFLSDFFVFIDFLLSDALGATRVSGVTSGGGGAERSAFVGVAVAVEAGVAAAVDVAVGVGA
jgi:hypothetical protein